MSLHGKMDVKIFLMFIVTENTRSVNIYIYLLNAPSLKGLPPGASGNWIVHLYVHEVPSRLYM